MLRSILRTALDIPFDDIPFYGSLRTAFDGASLWCNRLSYIGESGAELVIDERLPDLYAPHRRRDALWTAPGWLLRDERLPHGEGLSALGR